MRVRATQPGEYLGLRKTDAVFSLEERKTGDGKTVTIGEQFSARWMEAIDELPDDGPAAKKTKRKSPAKKNVETKDNKPEVETKDDEPEVETKDDEPEVEAGDEGETPTSRRRRRTAS